MLKLSKPLKVRRLALKNRADSHDKSLARTKFATGQHYILPSPSNYDDKNFKNEIYENPQNSLAARYLSEKEGHRENPIKDWLLAKPTRWQSEWTEYMKLKNEVESAAESEKMEKMRTDGLEKDIRNIKIDVFPPKYSRKENNVNFNFEKEIDCFAKRMQLPDKLLTKEAIKSITRITVTGQPIHPNDPRASSGKNFVLKYLQTFFKISFPNLPENLIKNNLIETALDNNYISYQIQHTGLNDFYDSINVNQKRSKNLNVEEVVELDVSSFYKMVDFLVSNSSNAEAIKFIQKIIISGILQKDVLRDLIKIKPNKAFEILKKVHKSKKECSKSTDIEPRLINKSSSSEIIRVYHIGLYDKESKDYIASSFGESVQAAIADASLVGLGEYYGVEEASGRMLRNLI